VWLARAAMLTACLCARPMIAGEHFTSTPEVQRSVSAKAGEKVPDGVFQVLPGFQVEKLFTVPKEQLGSWVAIGFDHKGRLLASDQQDKGLCRITLPPPGSNTPVQVERLDLKITAAQGILAAFDALYLSVNGGPGSGLYRARDTDGDDQYDELTKLKDFRGGGEHGPHALRLAPDGKSIYVVCGNHTRPPFDVDKPLSAGDSSRVPTNWGEDLLLPRQWDANGHARGILAPGGWIAKTDPDGKTWQIVSIGYRNAYDMALNAEGELFAYDSDMEWDMGSPWYRPTRVTHAASGSEFGWRSGTGKWPAYYVDSLPPLLDIGPGSPVGVEFGYGARFPARYQRALYLCDWTFGTMYALHLKPDGASYQATKEEFLSRTPLPLTDVAVGPDGGMYFTVGGRGTQSELYRVTYVGQENVEKVDGRDADQVELRRLRRQLEQLHQPSQEPKGAVDFVYPYLRHADRHIRYAARVALEHQPVKLWQERVLEESQPQALVTGVVGLARQGDDDLKVDLLAALGRLELGSLSQSEQLDLLRAYQLVFIRLGEPDDSSRTQLAARLDRYFPAESDNLNRELSTLLVYLRSPTIIGTIVTLLEQPAKRDAADPSLLLARNRQYGGPITSMLGNHPDLMQIHYAFVLRNMKDGWTLAQRKAYFEWFERASKWSGGASFQGFLRNIDRDAYENASEMERLAIEAFGARKPYQAAALPKPKGPGRQWTVAELMHIAQTGLKRRNFDNGKKMYAAARCVVCHRFGGEGGATGPDLTQLAGRFNLKDLSEAMIEPSKVISDQYRASTIETSDGNVYTGRVVSETAGEVTMLTHPEDPTKLVTIKKNAIEQTQPSTVSLMPKDLLQELNQDEVLDLLAYLLSRGEKNHPMFRP
jgi:putative heme-binding domain-containing protein